MFFKIQLFFLLLLLSITEKSILLMKIRLTINSDIENMSVLHRTSSNLIVFIISSSRKSIKARVKSLVLELNIIDDNDLMFETHVAHNLVLVVDIDNTMSGHNEIFLIGCRRRSLAKEPCRIRLWTFEANGFAYERFVHLKLYSWWRHSAQMRRSE